MAEVSVSQVDSLISGGSIHTAYSGDGDLFLQTTGGRWDALALIGGQTSTFLNSLGTAHVTIYTSDDRVPASVVYGAP